MAQNQVEILGRVAQAPCGRRIPLFAAGAAAGFPSPADDYIDRHLDLHEHLIEHPAATFYVRASGTGLTRTLPEALEALEREMILDALKSSRGNMAKAARALGISERVMGLRVKRLGIAPKRFRTSV
jgi:DNA-binding NtrC family response regulator